MGIKTCQKGKTSIFIVNERLREAKVKCLSYLLILGMFGHALRPGGTSILGGGGLGPKICL